MIVDDGLAFIASAKAARKPFYLNLWFHISHAPMLPTTAQLERFASDVYNTTDPVTLCNGPNQSPHKGGYVTCSSLVYRASQYEADTQIGRLLDYLRADKELDSQTLVSNSLLYAYPSVSHHAHIRADVLSSHCS
jgi:arylsulfatase A-like enzyme